MHHFRYSGHELHCESVDLAAVARLYGTPTYVYSAATIEDNYDRLQRGLTGLDLQICYAMKANSNLAMLRHFSNLGAGFDLVSGGEIRRVLAAGGNVKSSVFAGVGKTEAEIKLALENGIFAFHVESEPELARINHVAGTLGVKAPIAIRVNPDVDAHTACENHHGEERQQIRHPVEERRCRLRSGGEVCRISRSRGCRCTSARSSRRVAPFVRQSRRSTPLVDRAEEVEAMASPISRSVEAWASSIRMPWPAGQPAWWDRPTCGQASAHAGDVRRSAGSRCQATRG